MQNCQSKGCQIFKFLYYFEFYVYSYKSDFYGKDVIAYVIKPAICSWWGKYYYHFMIIFVFVIKPTKLVSFDLNLVLNVIKVILIKLYWI